MDTQKLLLIEDDGPLRHQTKTMLEDLGYNVVQAATAESGLKHFGQHLFPVVISDINLPGMSGLDAIKKMKDRDPALIPMIITGEGNQKVAIHALEAGVQHFLPKPFTKLELSTHVQNALQKHHEIIDQRLFVNNLMRNKMHLQTKIRECEQQLENLVNAAPLGIIATNTSHQILTFNSRAEQLYGYSSDEVIGFDFLKLVNQHPNTDTKFQTRHRQKSGSKISVIVYQQPIHNDRHATVGHLYLIEDKQERDALESQLLQAERLSTLGQLAPRIAHEFKTPLQVIAGNTELAQEYIAHNAPPKALKVLHQIPPSVQKLLSLIKQMSNLGKPTQEQKMPINLNAELEQLVETLQPLGVIKYCDIEWHLCNNLPPILGNEEQIEQAFRNLIVNAAQAMEHTTPRKLAITSCLTNNNQNIKIIIQDTGTGIPQDQIDKIFQPFFTTKSATTGTGLGLPIVKTILTRHNATCHVASQEGKGTTFTITFPTTDTSL